MTLASTKVNSLAWYAAAYGSSAALLKALGFLLFLWLARSLPVEDYATFGLFYAAQTALATMAIAGVNESIVGLLKEHHSPTMRRKLFSAANAVFALMSTASMGLAIFIFGFLFRLTSSSLIGFVCAIVMGILTAFLTLQAALVRLEERHLASLGFSFVAPLIGLVGGLIGFSSGQSVTAFFIGSAAGLAFSSLGLWIYGIGFYGFVSRTREVAPILLCIAPFICITFLGWLSGYGSNYLIKMLFAPSEIAKFTFTFTLASIMQLIASSLNQVWSPRFYRIIHERPFAEVERKNRIFFRSLGLAMGLAGGLVIAIFPWAIDMIGGNLIVYQSMQTELLILFAAYVVLGPWWHCQNHFLVHGAGQELMRVVVRTSVIGVVVWLLLMWSLGPPGIYLGFLAQMIVRMLSTVTVAKKLWSVTIAWGGVAVGLLLLGAGFTVSITWAPS